MINLINGNFQDASGNLLARGTLQLQATSDATLLASPGQIVSAIPIQFPIVAGVLSGKCQIYSSAELSPQIQYIATVVDANGARVGGPVYWQFPQPAGTTVDIGTMTGVSIGGSVVSFPSPVLLTPFGDQHITGTNNLTSAKFNGVIWLDGTGYTTLAAAYAALPSTGGVVMVPPNYSETLTSNLGLSKSNCGICFTGPATINLGTNQISISAGVSGAFIVGMVPNGAFLFNLTGYTANAGVQFVYTGTSAAIIGNGTGSTPLSAIRLENFGVDLTGAGSSAVGVSIFANQAGGWIRGVLVNGAGGSTSQIGIKVDSAGGSNSYDWSIENCQVAHVQTGILLNGFTQEMTLTGNQMWGGAASSIGIDLEGAFGSVVSGGNINGYTTGVKFGGNASNNQVTIPIGGFTTTASFGASTNGNLVNYLGTGTAVVSDSGTSNLFITNSRYPGLLNQQGPAAPVIGTGADVNIYSYTLPAGMLQAAKGLRITVMYAHSTGTASVTYKLKIGATTITSNAYANANTNTEMHTWEIFNNAGVQNAQNWSKWHMLNVTGNANLVPGASVGTSAVDFTASETIAFSFNVAATDQITPQLWRIELLQ